MQVLGLCRFSYPAIGGFQVEHESIEDRIAFLYHEHRIEERFRLFETVALPCLRGQTDDDFKLIVVIGEAMPSAYRDRLHDLTSDIPQIDIQAHPPRPQREVMKEVLNAARTHPDDPCLQFRFDDDDAFALHFIERLRKAEVDTRQLTQQYRSAAIDFCNGYVAQIGRDGISANHVYEHYFVAALAMRVKGGDPLTIMNFAHTRLPRFMPTITFSDEPMFVRTHSAFNDSRQNARRTKEVAVAPITADEELEFLTRFGINADHIRAAFA